MSRSAFLLGCVRSLGQGSSGRLDASGCDSPIPRDQGRRAHSCMAARGAAPSALQAAPARHSLSQPVPPLASAPHGPQDGGEGARRPHRGQPLCPPGRGPPTGSPHAEPQARGECPVSAPRHSRRPQHFFFFYLTPHRRTSGAARVAGPGSQAATTGLWRAPALLRREGRAPATPSARAASPRTTPEEAANPNPRLKCFSNPQTASALRARPLQGPGLWEAGASFAAAPTSRPARCLQSWCSRGPTRVAAGRALRGSTRSAGVGWAPWVQACVWADVLSAAGRLVPGLVLPFYGVWKPQRHGRSKASGGSRARTRRVSSVPLPAATVQRL